MTTVASRSSRTLRIARGGVVPAFQRSESTICAGGGR